MNEQVRWVEKTFKSFPTVEFNHFSPFYSSTGSVFKRLLPSLTWINKICGILDHNAICLEMRREGKIMLPYHPINVLVLYRDWTTQRQVRIEGDSWSHIIHDDLSPTGECTRAHSRVWVWASGFSLFKVKGSKHLLIHFGPETFARTTKQLSFLMYVILLGGWKDAGMCQ